MRKKGIVFIILIIIIAIISAIVVVKKVRTKTDEKPTEIEQPKEEVGTHFVIDSTKENQIEKDGFEATHIEINRLENQLEIMTTLKNNSNEPVVGCLIEFELKDKDGNTITDFAHDISDTINPGQELNLTSYAMLIEAQNVVSAQIVNIEKNNHQEIVEEFEEEVL